MFTWLSYREEDPTYEVIRDLENKDLPLDDMISLVGEWVENLETLEMSIPDWSSNEITNENRTFQHYISMNIEFLRGITLGLEYSKKRILKMPKL